MTEPAHKVQGVAKTFRVEAEMYVPAQKYLKGTYRIKISEPIALVDEHMMDNGKFSFDTVKEVKEKQRFKISILPVTS